MMSVCCSDSIHDFGIPLDGRWVRWVVTEALNEDLQLTAVRHTDEGWEPISPALLCEEFPGGDWLVTQQNGCRGIATRLLRVEDGKPVCGVRFTKTCVESPSWRALVLHALVLANREAA